MTEVMTDAGAQTRFKDLDLPPALLAGLNALGYEVPSPIQAQAIPHLLAGHDLLGHAPTGTGKTAAFALPLIARCELEGRGVQILTLAPTRELAMQVADAFRTYAAKLKDFRVLPIYGGQDYGPQLQHLRRGVHVVVGTPGRVTDHLRRGTLKLDQLRALVLDEADEMLRMGFKEEVEWILEQTPSARQVALFSATMPKDVESIARRHLRNPQEVSIKTKSATAETIRQRFWPVSGVHKLDALSRILEVESADGVLIFVRTKSATVDLAEKLKARGYSTAAMNGDMAQRQRELTVDSFKRGSLDVLVATDVAARGLDVDRISHVINYDIPYDAEAYIHRIGRTGRAGRTGEAILFVAPRERRMLAVIERATRKKIEQLTLPTNEAVNEKRIADFKQKITETLARPNELAFMRGMLEQYQREAEVDPLDIAAALAQIAQAGVPLLVQKEARPSRTAAKDRHSQGRRPDRTERSFDSRDPRISRKRKDVPPDYERFRIEVGHDHGVQPGNIVGAIANEGGLDAEHIGRVQIEQDHSLVDLPKGMPKEIFRDLRKTWVCGQKLKISRFQDGAVAAGKPKRAKASRGESSIAPPQPSTTAEKPKFAAKKRTKKADQVSAESDKKKKPKKNKNKGKNKKKKRNQAGDKPADA